MGHGDERFTASAVVVAEAACDHETVDVRPGPKSGHLTHAIPPAVRRAVMHRDGYRCAVPGCGNHVWCDVHHIQYRADGGNHEPFNLMVACTLHHRAIHDGRLAIERAADGTLRVERAVAEPPPMWDLLLDVLDRSVMDANEVASYLGVSLDRAVRLLRWHERRGEIVRTAGGAWARLSLVDAA